MCGTYSNSQFSKSVKCFNVIVGSVDLTRCAFIMFYYVFIMFYYASCNVKMFLLDCLNHYFDSNDCISDLIGDSVGSTVIL